MAGSEKSIELLLEAFRDAITRQNGWTTDRSSGEWRGGAFNMMLADHTELDPRTISRLLVALKSLGVIKATPLDARASISRKQAWTLLKPNARVVFENGVHKLAEKEA
jgi:hypothetical protein